LDDDKLPGPFIDKIDNMCGKLLEDARVVSIVYESTQNIARNGIRCIMIVDDEDEEQKLPKHFSDIQNIMLTLKPKVYLGISDEENVVALMSESATKWTRKDRRRSDP